MYKNEHMNLWGPVRIKQTFAFLAIIVLNEFISGAIKNNR